MSGSIRYRTSGFTNSSREYSAIPYVFVSGSLIVCGNSHSIPAI
jgi:hypothetical protein